MNMLRQMRFLGDRAVLAEQRAEDARRMAGLWVDDVTGIQRREAATSDTLAARPEAVDPSRP